MVFSRSQVRKGSGESGIVNLFDSYITKRFAAKKCIKAWAFTDLLNKLSLVTGTTTGATDLMDVVFTRSQVRKGCEESDMVNIFTRYTNNRSMSEFRF